MKDMVMYEMQKVWKRMDRKDKSDRKITSELERIDTFMEETKRDMKYIKAKQAKDCQTLKKIK